MAKQNSKAGTEVNVQFKLFKRVRRAVTASLCRSDIPTPLHRILFPLGGLSPAKINSKNIQCEHLILMTHIYLISLILRCPFRKVTNAQFCALDCPSLWIRNVRNDPGLNQSNLLQCLIILLHPTSSLINALEILREEKSADSSCSGLFFSFSPLTVCNPSRMKY